MLIYNITFILTLHITIITKRVIVLILKKLQQIEQKRVEQNGNLMEQYYISGQE